MPELDEEIQKSLRDIVTLCEKEDDEIRRAQIRLWKRNEEFWHGIQNLFWSEKDETWVSPASVQWRDQFTDEELEELGPFYDYVVDIFQAHGESIISALAAQVPALRFIPDDADDQADVLTAKTFSKIADLVSRHNNSKLLFIRALFYLYINGIVFSYSYKDTSEEYGTRTVPTYENQEQVSEVFYCPDCENVREPNESACPTCGSLTPPVAQTSSETVPVQTGNTEVPKSRAKLDIFGPLHVKVPFYARKQDECGYLLLSTDQPKHLVKFTFPDKSEEIEGETVADSDRFSTAEFGEYNIESSSLTTVIQAWLRPSEFWREKDDSKREILLKNFPNGCRVTFVGKNKVFISSAGEKLDERWEIGQAGISTFIHSDPRCRPLVPIQELRNQLVNLTVDTIEHGIPSTFADPEVLDFDNYGKFEAAPGYIYQAKRRGNQALSDGFFTEPKATLPREVPGLIRNLDQDAQFSTGSFPSIYGGPSEGKSRTFSEYAASRQMALQRLSIVWSLATDWWTRTMENLVRLYATLVVDDERYAKFDAGSYVNVWIRQSELQGKVGGVEPEASDAFPISLVQKRDQLIRLIELNNEYINAALYTPDNARLIADTLAMNEFKPPGEVQRVKQVLEINELIKGEAVEQEPGNFVPSVLPEPEVDDDEVHVMVLKNFLADLAGLDLKRTNPTGYLNCLAHLRLHQMSLQMKVMQQSEASLPGEAPDTTATQE